MALLKVNDMDLPAPVRVKPGISDLDSEDGTGRNQAGDMFRDRVTVKRSIECEWGPSTKEEMSTILTAISAPSFYLTYPDPQEGALKTITAYASDRSVPLLIPISDTDWMWSGLTVTFTEM